MGGKKTPKVVQRDPVQDQIEAERRATIAANAEVAMRKKESRYSSFLATGGGQAGIESGRFRSALASSGGGSSVRLGGSVR